MPGADLTYGLGRFAPLRVESIKNVTGTTLNIQVDNVTKVSPAVKADFSFPGRRVVEVLEQIANDTGRLPKVIHVDNRPEFVSKALDEWAHRRGVKLAFSRPGKPTDNAFIEAFNGRLRQECLNQNWFLSLDDARQKLSDWHREYNTERPHTTLKMQTPASFAAQWKQPEITA